MLNDGDAETAKKPFWELNKFHFDDPASMRDTGRGVAMLAVLSAWGLLARPDAPPMRVLRVSGNSAAQFYMRMGFTKTLASKDLQLNYA